MKAVLLAALLVGCGASNQALRPAKPIPEWAHYVDLALFTAGACTGVDGQFSPRGPREFQMYAGYGLALAVWLSWWATKGDE